MMPSRSAPPEICILFKRSCLNSAIRIAKPLGKITLRLSAKPLIFRLSMCLLAMTSSRSLYKYSSRIASLIPRFNRISTMACGVPDAPKHCCQSKHLNVGACKEMSASASDKALSKFASLSTPPGK